MLLTLKKVFEINPVTLIGFCDSIFLLKIHQLAIIVL